MPFANLAVPFDAYAQLPSPQHRWVLMALARYADREGRCWPSMRQLARDARMSKSSVCRYLADLSQLGVFSRSRRPGGRYRYEICSQYHPQWSGASAVRRLKPAVPDEAMQKVIPSKHQTIPDDSSKWEARLRVWHKRRFWLPYWGPKPSESGCWAPGVRMSLA